MVNPIVRSVLELAERIQGKVLAFDRHPEGGVRPAFPVMPDSGRGKIFVYGGEMYFAPEPPDGTVYALTGEQAGYWVEATAAAEQSEETYFVDETGEYGPTRPGV